MKMGIEKIKVCGKCSGIDIDRLREELKNSDCKIKVGCIGHCRKDKKELKNKAYAIVDKELVVCDSEELFFSKLKHKNKKKEHSKIKIRPYITLNGQCAEAIELYKRAFKTDAIQIMKFSDMPNADIPKGFKDRILQCTLKFGDDFIRLSDCGPNQKLNDPESERISLAIETDVETVKFAFDVLAEEGRVGMPLAETFYSPCAGVVFDKFGVMWNFVGQ